MALMHLHLLLPGGEAQRFPNPFCTPGALQGTQCENPSINGLMAGKNDWGFTECVLPLPIELWAQNLTVS